MNNETDDKKNSSPDEEHSRLSANEIPEFRSPLPSTGERIREEIVDVINRSLNEKREKNGALSISRPIQTLRCPNCESDFDMDCEGLDKYVVCETCGKSIIYADAYLNYYKAYIEVFVNQVHSIPLTPGYTNAGEAMVPPDELLLVDFDVKYRQPPRVFFVLPGQKVAEQWIQDNQILFPISVERDNFIIFFPDFRPVRHTQTGEHLLDGHR